jgi:hypothetical protein
MNPLLPFVIIAALSSMFSAVAAVSSGQQARRMGEYNALLAERQAEEKRQQAEYQANRQREQGEALRARQRLLFGVAGVTPAGTPTDLMADTAKQLEIDALAIEYGGESAGKSLELQANLRRMQGAASENAGWWNAGKSLLSGATTIAGAYGGFGKSPVYDATGKQIGTTGTFDISGPK